MEQKTFYAPNIKSLFPNPRQQKPEHIQKRIVKCALLSTIKIRIDKLLTELSDMLMHEEFQKCKEHLDHFLFGQKIEIEI